jgi:hypothetical protein
MAEWWFYILHFSWDDKKAGTEALKLSKFINA